MSVIAGLTATKAALDIAKVIMDKLNTANVDVHSVRAGVQEMLIHVVNAQTALGDARTEISDLREEIERRDALASVAADLDYQTDGGFYTRKSNGAICCPVCWGDKEKAVPMTPLANGHYQCAIHRSIYQTNANRDERRRKSEEARAQSPRRSGPTSWMGI
jgi:hypothetical protein